MIDTLRLRRPWAAYIAAFGLVTAGVGCGRNAELAYTPRAELSSLPDKHQKEIQRILGEYFGTPADPRLMIPASEAEEAAESPAAESSGDGDESPTEEKPTVKLVDKFDRQHLKLGAHVYTVQCAPCHGTTGDGRGPAADYLNPPPRDYRMGRFKFTSTPRGIKPRREDLVRIIRRGAKGTSMPAFRWLPEEELQAVLDYVVLLSSRGELELKLKEESEIELEPEDDFDLEVVADYATRVSDSWAEAKSQIVLPLTTQPPLTEESVQAGAKAFIELNCFKCHGKDGSGNRAFNVGKDDWGQIAFAADLTSGMLHGGRRPLDIYRRIYSGINGTPMPAFKDPDSTKNETPEQRSETIWHMVHFVLSIVDGKPLPMDLIDETIKSLPAATEAGAAAEGSGATEPTTTETPPGEKPADAKPAEEAPAEEKPAEAKPAESKPAEEKPAEAKPAETEPEESKPTEAKPSETKPTEAKPAEAKSADESASG